MHDKGGRGLNREFGQIHPSNHRKVFSLSRVEALLSLIKNELKRTLGKSFSKDGYTRVFTQVFSREIDQGVANVPPTLLVNILGEEDSSFIKASSLLASAKDLLATTWSEGSLEPRQCCIGFAFGG